MSIARVLAALHLPKRVPDLIPHCNGIVAAMTDNDNFPTPTPSLTLVTAHIGTLATAQAAMSTHAKGAVEERGVARTIVVSNMHGLKAYVQGIADANRAKAETIITSARMTVAGRAFRQKQIFAVERGLLPMQAILYAPVAGPGATYEWGMSTDQQDWIALPPTKQASTLVDGLAPLTTHYFRFRSVTWVGVSAWSHALGLLVL